MVAPNPDWSSPNGLPADRELREHVLEIIGNVASTVRRPANGRHVPIAQIVLAAGRPFRVTIEMVDCDAAFGGVLPFVTIREVTARTTLSQWIKSRFGLTSREARVASLLARRRSNAEIARVLHISPHTARHHTEKVMNKLSVRSRFAVRAVIRDAVRAARRREPGGGVPLPARDGRSSAMLSSS